MLLQAPGNTERSRNWKQSLDKKGCNSKPNLVLIQNQMIVKYLFEPSLPESFDISVLMHTGHFPGLVADLQIPRLSSWTVLAVSSSLLLDEFSGLWILHLTTLPHPLLNLFPFFLFFLFVLGLFLPFGPVCLSGRPVRVPV